MNELMWKDMPQIIDSSLRFFTDGKIIISNLTNKEKLSLLKKQKQYLEIEWNFYADRFSDTDDKEVIRECESRLHANEMVIGELNICISYLKDTIAKEKKLQRKNKLNSSNIFPKIKSLILGK